MLHWFKFFCVVLLVGAMTSCILSWAASMNSSESWTDGCVIAPLYVTVPLTTMLGLAVIGTLASMLEPV